MSGRNDGGPVSPTYASDSRGAACNTTFYPSGGMSLRDWFAGQALAGLLASEAWCRDHPYDVARAAYEQADAMLEARKGGDS